VSRRAKFLLLVLLVALGAGGYYLRALAKRVFLELAPHAEETARAKLSQIALQPNNGPVQMATLYFPSLSEGKLATESRAITWAPTEVDRVRQIVLALAEGSHQGYGRVFPATTTARAVFITGEGTVYLDLSDDLRSDFPTGIQTETLTVYAIVNSIATNVTSARRVQLLIQGQQVETLDGHVDLTSAFIPDLGRVKSNP